MTPLLSKSLAAWLNSSKDKGLGFISFVFNFGVGSRQRGMSIVAEVLLVATWSHGTNTGGRISSSSGVCDSWGTAMGVITFSLFWEDVSSDNMGNKEFSVGTFSFKEGIKFN